MLIHVPADAAGARLDTFLGAHVGSRAQAQRLIDDHHVLVDGVAVPKRARLSGGERIVVDPPAVPATPLGGPQAPYGVAFEDEALIVVDKPAGVVVHPAPGHPVGTLSQALAERGATGGDAWRAGIVHRLDRDTSGLLVVAKTVETHRRLKRMLAARQITREYLVLVDGAPPALQGTIEAPLGRDRRLRARMSIDTDLPRDARTHFELDRALPTAALLRVRLDTGRTHQIRAHFEAIGSPVCGDTTYGRAGAFGLDRQFLHAARLAFHHPLSGDELDLRSPLPEDLRAALERAATGRE